MTVRWPSACIIVWELRFIIFFFLLHEYFNNLFMLILGFGQQIFRRQIKTEEMSMSDKQNQKKIELLEQQQQAITILKINNFENLIINNTSTHPSTNQRRKNKFFNLSNEAQLSGKASSSFNTSDLSNFLVVRFELCSNQETTSKSKSKYKNSIKIISVSSKPPKYFKFAAHGNIQLKTNEFTEKFLSFRLACSCFDLNSVAISLIEKQPVWPALRIV